MSKCNLCNKYFKNLRGLGVHNRLVHSLPYESQKETDNEEITNLKNRLNQLSLKFTVLERKLQKTIESGVVVKEQSEKNTEAIERIKKETSIPKSREELNMVVVINELKIIFQTGNPRNVLEKVSQSQMNHKNIYEVDIIETRK